jgi:carbamoyltransferase
MSVFVLGLNAYHGDAAACLLRDGELVAAAEEERFRRIKHWAGLPAQAMAWCASEAGIALSEVQHLAINHSPRANLLRRIGYGLRTAPSPGLVLERMRNRRQRGRIEERIEAELNCKLRAQVHRVEHHHAHLASAFLASPFERGLAVSVDGFGDFASAAWGMGDGRTVGVDARIHFPHSLGIFYQALTQYLGFPRYGDEYKVMGLAPYGKPAFLDEMRGIVRCHGDGRFSLDLRFFRHHREKIEYRWDGGEPEVGALFSRELERLLGPSRRPDEELTQRHKDIARSVQAMYEEAFFNLLASLHARYRVDALCLAGGCAMNSVANGRIHAATPFRRLYVQAAAGDAGGAIGAAYAAWSRIEPEGARFPMSHAYWGPSFTDDEIGSLVASRAPAIAAAGCELRREGDDARVIDFAARAIARGAVLGWFQGRMEWGPRALGNRSIVCDPRRADMKSILNEKIKRRESFRPFAPSILRERAGEWFEVEDDVPFMAQVYPVREEKRALVPAVTHVDGSGRLQTVAREANPRYHRLIERFDELTGVPLVLNTSFNENEPIVRDPGEALECFLRTRMDALVLGNWIVSRRAGEAPPDIDETGSRP